MPDKKEEKDPVIVHGKSHPDHGKFNVVVAEASDEAIKKEQETIKAARDKQNPPDWRDLKDGEGKTYWDKQSGEAASTSADYESQTVPELTELAAKRGVTVPAGALKADIIKALEKNDKKAA